MSRQRVLAAKKVNSFLGCRRRSVASRLRDPSLLLSPGKTKFGVMCPVLGSQIQERGGAIGTSQQRAMKTIRRLEDLSYKDRLRELGLFSLKNRRSQ